MDVLQAITGLGAAAGAVLVVFMFLKDRETERKSFLEDRKQDRVESASQRELDRTLWTNHLSQSIKVQAETASVIAELVTSIKVMQTENQSSVTWARDAMQGLIREIGRSQPARPSKRD